MPGSGFSRIHERALAALFRSSLAGTAPPASRQADHAPAPDLAAGDVIASRYRVLDVKQGGLGRVYLCDQLGTSYQRGDSRCALKTPIPSLLRETDVIDSFIDEAVNWVSLPPHPNTVLAYGVEMHARLPYIVMEYVDGGTTLADLIVRGEHSWQLALKAGIGLARALSHAQMTGRLSHGDLKPNNVMWTPAGAAKLTDFGFSKSLVSGRGVKEGWRVGTQGFIAPEMYADAPMPTQASDMYAYGVTLFQCATARAAGDYSGVTTADVCSLAPGMPGALAELIVACVRTAPRQRPAGFAEILEQLQSIHAAVSGGPAPDDPSPDLPSPSEALRNAAQSWLNVGEWNKARALAKQAIEHDASNWHAHNALGLVYREAGEHGAARRCFLEAHALDAHEIVPVVNAALSANDQGDKDDAGRLLLKALDLADLTGQWSQIDGVSSLIVDLFAAGEALELLERVLSANPRAAITWNNRAILLRRARRSADALDSANRAIAINPVYAKAWSNRATAEVELARWDDAVESADQAIALDPLLTGPYLAKATALAQSGRLPQARACLAGAIALKPGDPQLQQAQVMFSR